MKKIFITLTLFIGFLPFAFSCTNFLVTKGASVNGSTMISYNADSHTLYGELYHYPAATYAPGTMRKITDWDTGKPLGEIPEAPETYNVVGNVNEYQVAIGETTYGGREELVDTSAIIDYGSLIYIALQRSKTAREAIKVMTTLVAKYGYCSEGESFSIADPNEAWILEMIGKGPNNTGAVWVARLIPDGYVSAHANQARITTFPLESRKNKNSISFKHIDKIFNPNVNVVYADDVISFARKEGFYTGKDEDFSFSDTYNPLNFEGQRFCEARVWSFFNHVNHEAMIPYLDYAMGKASNRMPLYIKPLHKLSHRDIQNEMGDHFEGTPMDMTKDAGAGPYACPYRWRPLTWKVDSVEYCNERASGTQQTGFTFVAELRNWMPRGFGLNWFGVDDAATTVYMPMYTGITTIPKPVRAGNGDMLHFSWTSAFWIFNWVANQAYSKYSYMIKDIKPIQKQLEDSFDDNQKAVEEKALALDKVNHEKAMEYLNNYCTAEADTTLNTWKRLGEFLLVKYIDGNVKKEVNGKFKENGYGQAASPLQPGYSEKTYREIVNDNGKNLRVEEIKK